eukprot:Skav202685  [mRNA]  locus=scaffold1791:746792:748141:- [translate_table: standard]
MGQAGGVIVDEISQVQAPLLHAVSLRMTYARMLRYNLNPNAYATVWETFGKTGFVLLSGDHLQLPPVPQRTSLLAPLEFATPEHKTGAAIFSSMPTVFAMETAMRFDDETLRSILHKMRTPGGKKLSEHEWAALEATKIENHVQNTSWFQKTKDYFHSSYLWSIVTMVAYYKAKESASAANTPLFLIQAVQKPAKTALKEHYVEMLRVPSLSTTRRLPGITAVHIGMRIRLTTSVLPPWAVQDSAGTVMAIDFGENQPPSHHGVCAGEVLLRALPLAIYVQLDDCQLEFLPPTPCDGHQLLGFDSSCSDCKRHPGLIQIKPQTFQWYFQDKDFSTTVERTTFGIMPEKACPLYGLQGTTTKPGLVAHFNFPARATSDIKFLIVYVLLSRVCNLKSLIAIDLTAKVRDIIEAGPPDGLVCAFDSLFDAKIAKSKKEAFDARIALGWPPKI